MTASDLTFVSLNAIPERDIIALMNEPAVGRLLPLLGERFTDEDCRTFLAAKQALWDTHGFGPWAFRIDGEFAGWGGLQPERGEADFALILHPKFWGWGRRIFGLIKDRAFGPMGLSSITALLPPNRSNAGAIRRLGFLPDGETSVDGVRFLRFRLSANAGPSSGQGA